MGKTNGSSRTFLRCSLWGLGMIASILIVCGLSFTLARSPLFLIRQVDLDVSGRPGPVEIRSLSGIRTGMNLLALDTEEVSRRLETHPWIRHASVVKRLPDRVLIRVRKREPALLVVVHGCLYYMDAEGKILDRVLPGGPIDFPMVTGLEQDAGELLRCGDGRDIQQVLSLLSVLQSSPGLGSLSEIRVNRSEGLSFVLERFPVPVYVGWSGFAEKSVRLERVLPSLVSQLNAIERVDLRYSGQIVLKERKEVRVRASKRGESETLAGSDLSFHPTT